MSRIDDDHTARRNAERIALQKRTEEQKAKRNQDEATAFSKLLKQGKEQPQAQQQQQARRPASFAQQILSEATRSEQSNASHLSQSGAGARKSAFGELMGAKDGNAPQTPQQAEGRAGGGEALVQQGAAEPMRQQAELRETHQTHQGRTEDAKGGNERLEERSGSHEKTNDVLAGRRGGELRTGREQGGSGQGGGDQQGRDSNSDKSGAAGAFRFNPALMAPVGVARPKEVPNSERLRRIATEIAQKIVERVRVGTNAIGNAEFQIDLRSDVLSGLSIKLSMQNGKLKAAFSGNNREVLKLLGEHAETLKEALGKRGLTLEELKIEERA